MPESARTRIFCHSSIHVRPISRVGAPSARAASAGTLPPSRNRPTQLVVEVVAGAARAGRPAGCRPRGRRRRTPRSASRGGRPARWRWAPGSGCTRGVDAGSVRSMRAEVGVGHGDPFVVVVEGRARRRWWRCRSTPSSVEEQAPVARGTRRRCGRVDGVRRCGRRRRTGRRAARGRGRPARWPRRRRGSRAAPPGGGGANSSPTRSCICSRVSASSAANGSSSSSSSGSRTSARASATRWASPPDSVAGHAGAWSAEADLVERLTPAALAPRPRRWPMITLASTRVDGTSRGSWYTVVRTVGHEHLAVVGSLEPGQDAQQRRLARAARAQQRDELAAADVEVDAVEHDVVAERLGDAAQRHRQRPDVGAGRVDRRRRSAVHPRTAV